LAHSTSHREPQTSFKAAVVCLVQVCFPSTSSPYFLPSLLTPAGAKTDTAAIVEGEKKLVYLNLKGYSHLPLYPQINGSFCIYEI